jgi:hypothetical protein
MSASLEGRFHAWMVDVYHRVKAETGYNATYFLQMVSERGGVDAARRLLHSTAVSDGFTALWERRRLDLSVEALVLDEESTSSSPTTSGTSPAIDWLSMGTDPEPEALLAEAQRLLDGEHDLDCWPIATAILLRCALEISVERHLVARGDVTAGASMRSQLLALAARRGDDDLAAAAAIAWSDLSRAVHHHAYEVAPTVGELRHLGAVVASVAGGLAVATAAAGESPASGKA